MKCYDCGRILEYINNIVQKATTELQKILIMVVKILLIIYVGFICNIQNSSIDVAEENVAAQDASSKITNTRQGSQVVRARRSYYVQFKSCRDVHLCGKQYLTQDSMCHCDDLCVHFGDCCWNASPNSSTTQNLPKMECVEFGKGSMVWTVRNCPSDYRDAEVKAKCHTNVSSDDPVLTVPVLDTTTKITYQKSLLR